MRRFRNPLNLAFFKGQWLTWKFFLFISVICWLIARYTQADEQNIFSLLGLISAILCLFFFVQENIFRVSVPALVIPQLQFLNYWTIGLLLCVVVGISLKDKIPQWFWVSVPLILGGLTAVPAFLESGLQLKLPAPAIRQRLMIILLLHGLVSCWVQFYFIINNWVITNPNLNQQDFTQSHFVIKF